MDAVPRNVSFGQVDPQVSADASKREAGPRAHLLLSRRFDSFGVPRQSFFDESGAEDQRRCNGSVVAFARDDFGAEAKGANQTRAFVSAKDCQGYKGFERSRFGAE